MAEATQSQSGAPPQATPSQVGVAEGTADEKHGFRRKLVGRVYSDKMDKTVVVEVDRFVRHRKYKKYMKTRERYKAHDPENYYREGDEVEIQESRPLSRGKRWKVIRLVRGSAERILEELKAAEAE